MSTNIPQKDSKPPGPTSIRLTSELQCHVNGCLSPYPSVASLVTIRKLGMNGHFTDHIISSGIVPRLIELLDWHQHPEIQYEATWILTNIVAGTTNQTRVVMELDGHQKLIQLINHHSLDIQHTAIEALGNIAGDSETFRNQLLDNDLLSHLLPFCSPIHSVKILRSVTWTLGGLCRTKPLMKSEYLDSILKGLSILMFFEDDEILTNVCWAYCHLLRANDIELDTALQGSESTENIIAQYAAKSFAERERFQTVMTWFGREINADLNLIDDPNRETTTKQGTATRTTLYVPTDVVGECYKMYALFSESKIKCFHNDIVRRMVTLLDPSTNSTVLHSAIVAFGNMQRYMMEEAVVTLDREHGIMYKLKVLLDSPELNVRRDSCWVISNIIVTLGPHSELIIGSGILPKVMDIVRVDKYEVAIEALWATANSVEKYYGVVVEHGIIDTVFSFMARSRDKETFMFTMDILGSIVHGTGGEHIMSREICALFTEANAIANIVDWTERHRDLIDTRLQQRIDTMLGRLQRYLGMFDAQSDELMS